MMFSGIVFKQKSTIKLVAIALMALLFVLNLTEIYGQFHIQINTNGMLVFTRFGLVFNAIILLATTLYFLVSGSFFEKVGINVAEYFALIFFVIAGIAILSSFNNLLMLFLGIEIMTIPLFILTGSDKRNLKSNEASLKYFLMGSFSTGILLMGIALMYGANGNFNIEQAKVVLPQTNTLQIIEPVGLLFIFVAFLFKVSAAPFHFWAPDVYDGAPAVFTGFMTSMVKAAGFVAFVHLFSIKCEALGASWKILLPLIIVLTLIFGNITAIFQTSVKRMLAYSSVAQAGFMLFALYGGTYAQEGLLLYSAAYSLATVGIFSILIRLNDFSFEGYNGLAKQSPLIALANLVFFLSLAGIPLTAGFFGKYFMLSAALQYAGIHIIWLIIVAMLFAATSVYYYFKVIQAMYFKSGNNSLQQVQPGYLLSLMILVVLIVWIGVYPQSLTYFLYF